MSASSQPPIDRVLLAAWRRLMYYDRISYNEKENFIKLRKIVILVTFFGSLASIAVILFDFLPTESLNFIGLLALSLPIVALAVMQYTSRYAAPTTWIQYRYAAEKIRSNIYMYRTQAGVYNVEDYKRDNLLLKAVKDAEKTITNTVPQEKRAKDRKLAEPQATNLEKPIGEMTTYEAAMAEIAPALKYSGGDDGFLLPLSLEQYIKTRVYLQRDWYRDRVQKDYYSAKRFSQWSLSITAIGSVLGLALGSQQVQWVGVVAIANALSVSVNAWGNARMFGKTYGIYDKTARLLEDTEGDWHAHQNDPDFASNFESYKRDFIQQVEAILAGELDSWYSIATETQVTNDQMLVSNIRDLQTDATQTKEDRTQAMVNQLKELPPQLRTEQVAALRVEMDKIETTTPTPTGDTPTPPPPPVDESAPPLTPQG
ncbi:MAG: DUF4231 domain-containing protein [bacterium]|nr:DUF4231 domain-containing protein [bacterium]